MSAGSWVPLVGGLIVSTGGGLGVAAFLQVRATKARILSEARKFQADARKTDAETESIVVDNLEDALRILGAELTTCREERGALRGRVAELEEHVAQLERRRDWHRRQPDE